MPSFLSIKPLKNEHLEKIGFLWFKDHDGEYIVRDKLLSITSQEAQAYHDATNELYKMYEEGAEYVIKNNLFEQLDIPPSLIPEIKRSFATERELHLYGRFDLSGGIDNREIKLIEFNADTPTLLLETALIQVMMLEYAQLENVSQFNTIYGAIAEKFVAIAATKRGEYSRFLFSCVEGIEEEYETVKLLERMAKEKQLNTDFCYLEESEGREAFDFWFKLYPWEDMEHFQREEEQSMLNPAYTLLYQSKGMLAILYKLFPDSPYLLETSFSPLSCKYVKKRMFGREGANIEIVENSKLLKATDGIYGEYKSIYQAYTPFVRDAKNLHYQAGVFYSNGACGLGFRRGAEILDDMSQFVGHVVRDETAV